MEEHMTSKKRIVKVSPKKLVVEAPASKKVAASKSRSDRESTLDDKAFKKHLKTYMKEKESLMKNLSKR